ncbi:MAG: FG-GAP repeat protein [Ignavibacteriae bacterium]|nr:FG-GAP repeat protein [Ignavibacteriota bacterium]
MIRLSMYVLAIAIVAWTGASAQDFSTTILEKTGVVEYGPSVGVGDVNGDGFADVIVGAPYANTTGRAYLYFGGSSMETSADVIFQGAASGDHFGWSVDYAGDVNNDGYGDVVVGAMFSGGSGKVYIYFGGPAMDNVADVTLVGEGGWFGDMVRGGGDMNNDGYDDIVVGAKWYGGGNGRTYIFYGGSPMNSVADLVMTGSAGGTFGQSISCNGDINNDGFDDVVAGEILNGAGKAYVFFGGTAMNNTADVVLDGEVVGSCFGGAVCNSGDFNGDGFDDVIVGSYNLRKVYVFYGGTAMDNVVDLTFTGPAGLSGGFRPLTTTGDLNGDGYDDLVAGAFESAGTGQAFVLFGGPNSDNTIDKTFTGTIGGAERFGYATVAGDINHDGRDDLVIGAPGPLGLPNGGHAYVYLSVQSTFTISGCVSMILGDCGAGVSLSGVSMNGLPGTPVTDANGYFTSTVPAGWSGTATPSLEGYKFLPLQKFYANVQANLSNEHFKVDQISISGIIRTQGGLPIEGVAVGSGSTNALGKYEVWIPPMFPPVVTLTPTKSGYIFDPPQRSYYVQSVPMTNQDFVGTPTSAPGSFETGLEDWTSSGCAIASIVNQGCNSAKAAKISITGKNCNAQFFKHGFSIERGKRYRVKFNAWSSRGEDMQLTVLPHNASTPNVGLDRRVDLGTTSCASYTFEFTATANTNDARLRFLFTYMSTTGYWYVFDNVSIERVLPKEGESMVVPTFHTLEQNYPNPFNPITTIAFQIPGNGHVTLKVYDMLGREVATIVDGIREAGVYEEVFDATALASGVYLYRLQAGDFSQIRKLTVLK